MNFSKYIVGMNDRRRIKGWIFAALGLGDAFVIYQKTLSRMAWKSFVAACVAAFSSFSYGSNTNVKMNYESEAEPRNFSLFFLRIPLPPNVLLNDVRPLSQSFCACRFKASDKKESFGIMVILQLVKRNTNEGTRKDKGFKSM